MQQILDSLKNSFPAYHEEVNQFFLKNTSSWDALLLKYKNSPIYRSLLYVIKTFLESENRQLFIQFPTDRLGRFEDEQKSNLSAIQGLIADLLYLASKTSWEPKLNCPEISKTQVGEFYYSANRVWEIKESQIDGLPRPSSSAGLRTSEARAIFNDSRQTGIRLLRTKELPPRKIIGWTNQINLYRSLPAIASYEKCFLVGVNQYWQEQPIGNEYLYCPIKFSTRFVDIAEEPCDVLVFLWDRKYLPYERDINNLIAEGKVKKIIYIGTDIFDGFKDIPSNSVFSYTFRELFSYYFDFGRFPSIEFKKLAFPELEKYIIELSSIIPQKVDDSERKRISRYALYPFLKMYPSKSDSEKLKNFLWDNYEVLTPDEIDRLVSWSNSVSFSSKTPKEIADNKIVAKLEKPKFYILPPEAYKGRLNDLLKFSNGNKQIFIIDALMNGNQYVDIVKSLLERGCLGTYYILSYFELPLLKKFFTDEIDVYNGAHRRQFVDISIDVNQPHTDAPSNNLFDYYDSSSDDLSQIFNVQTQIGRQISYSCQFNDELGPDIVDGDVIFHSTTIRIDDLYNNSPDYLPCEITYYKTPPGFQHLMELYFNFPTGQTVDYFSQLWKTKMQVALQTNYGGKINEMWKDFRFLKFEKLKAIMRPAYHSNFPEEIGQIAIALNKLGLITNDEAHLIRAANTVVGKHSSKAKELKSSLFKYYISGDIAGFLKHLLKNGESRGEVVDIENIVNGSLVTRELIEIKINKK